MKMKKKKKNCENDQLTGHFQSFLIYLFSSPPTLNLKKIPVNQVVKNTGLNSCRTRYTWVRFGLVCSVTRIVVFHDPQPCDCPLGWSH